LLPKFWSYTASEGRLPVSQGVKIKVSTFAF
jgi:hypothetical protein